LELVLLSGFVVFDLLMICYKFQKYEMVNVTRYLMMINLNARIEYNIFDFILWTVRLFISVFGRGGSSKRVIKVFFF